MPSTSKPSELEEIGRGLAVPVGIYGFFAAWAYCAWHYGFLLGFGFGWLPAGILAAMLGALIYALWPAALALAGLGVVYGVAWVGTFVFGWW